MFLLNSKLMVEKTNTERMIHPVGKVIKLELPTPYGGTDDNQLVHLSVVRIPTKLSGYVYWATGTPYPNNDASKENPCIFASNDGINWAVPTGITNPIFGPPETGFYADNSLMWDGAKLTLHWVHNTGSTKTLQSTSTNGITWTTPVELALDLSDGYPVYDFSNDITRVFSRTDMNYGFEITQRYIKGTDLDPTSRVLFPYNLPGYVYHAMVSADQGGWHFIFPLSWQGNKDYGKNLYYGFSHHGFNAVFDPVPIVTPNDALPVAGTENIYTGIMVQSPKPDIYYLYFTARANGNYWWVGMVPVKLNTMAIANCLRAANLPVNILLFSEEIRDEKTYYSKFTQNTAPLFSQYKHKSLTLSNTLDKQARIFVTGRFGKLSGSHVTIDGTAVSPITVNANSGARITEASNKLLSYVPGEHLAWSVRATDNDGNAATPTTGRFTATLTMWN